jgi:uridine kinase
MNPSQLIVIAGGSGSGKSHLARRLHHALEPRAAILTLDHFYHDLSHLPHEERDLANFDDPAAIDWSAVETALGLLTNGLSAEIPRYDFASHTRAAESDRLDPVPLLILEGLWPLTRAFIRQSATLSIFVDGPADLRLARRISRDTAERGRSEESVRRQFHEHVAPMHDLHVQPQATLADLVFAPDFGDDEISSLLLHPALLSSR